MSRTIRDHAQYNNTEGTDMAKNKNQNNGVIATGTGDVVITDTVIGDPGGTNPTATNNGVIASGSGSVVITGMVMGTGNQVG